MKRKPNILVCPLDWGIGHATRCIPIINELIQKNVNVIIGADNKPYYLLKKEFPQLKFVRFPGYKFSYPGNEKMVLKMAKQIPAILSGIKSEHRFLKNLIQKLNIDAVISDNRFGLYNNAIPCIFLTHQVFIKVPDNLKFIEPILHKLNKHYVVKYNECWIPDWENGFTLSGDLSHKKPQFPNTYFIGPLSRFGKNRKKINPNYKYDFAVIISGPEPQRSILEEIVLEQIADLKGKGIIVLGRPDSGVLQSTNSEKVTTYPHLGSKELEELIIDSKIIICRPGYSSIMDLVVLGKQAIFIPTPGQTEQEYLAEYYFENGIFFRMSQKELDINVALKQIDGYPGFYKEYDSNILKERISNLISKL